MLKRQKNKLAMYGSVHAYLEDNSAVYSENEEFSLHSSALDENLAEIRLKEDLRNKATKGKTKDKSVTRDSVITDALAVAGALYNLAKKAGNQILMAATDLTKSKLDKLRDVELVIELNSIRNKAIERATEISKFGISADKLDSYANSIRIYSAALGSRDTGGSVKKGAFKSHSTLFDEADSLMESFDKFMENYKKSNEDFYAGYKTARVIKDLGIRHNEEEEDEAVQTAVPEQTAQ